MNDYIYYVMVDDIILTENIFSTWDEAEEYAEAQAFKDYHIVRWDVD